MNIPHYVGRKSDQSYFCDEIQTSIENPKRYLHGIVSGSIGGKNRKGSYLIEAAGM